MISLLGSLVSAIAGFIFWAITFGAIGSGDPFEGIRLAFEAILSFFGIA
ncbi:MAG: hypothetical protein LBR73_04685 [Oscillospiraceae bacterium]|nr:hypothetical protein [Oscillospiraceae bacterium]